MAFQLELLERRQLLCATGSDVADEVASATCTLTEEVHVGTFEEDRFDTDVFAFHAMGGERFLFEAQVDEVMSSDSATSLGIVWSILSKEGDVLAQAFDLEFDDWRAETEGTYYLRVEDYSIFAPYPLTYNIQWQRSITPPDDHVDVIGDEAVEILAGQLQNVIIDDARDRDVLVYHPEPGERFEVVSRVTAGPSRVVIQVFGQDGELIGNHASIESDGPVYVEVSLASNSTHEPVAPNVLAEVEVWTATQYIDEPDSVDEASPQTFIDQVAGVFHESFDRDVFAFQATPCEVFKVHANSDASVVASVSNSKQEPLYVGEGVWYANELGTYYISVYTDAFGLGDEYELQVEKAGIHRIGASEQPQTVAPLSVFYAEAGEIFEISLEDPDAQSASSALLVYALDSSQQFGRGLEGKLSFVAPYAGNFALRVPTSALANVSFRKLSAEATELPVAVGTFLGWYLPGESKRTFTFEVNEPRLISIITEPQQFVWRLFDEHGNAVPNPQTLEMGRYVIEVSLANGEEGTATEFQMSVLDSADVWYWPQNDVPFLNSNGWAYYDELGGLVLSNNFR